MAEEMKGAEPDTEEIQFKASIKGEFKDISQRFSSLQMYSMRAEADKLTLVRIESRDIQKRPYLFYIFELGRNSLTVSYTRSRDASVKMRRLFVLKNLLSVLSLVSDLYVVDDSDLFQHVDSAIDDVINALSPSYSSLFNNYDSLFNEYRELKRLNLELQASNKELLVRATQLESDNKALKERMSKLEAYSDESLMVMVEDWIESHDGTIDINEFSKSHNIVSTRVEDVLNKMVSQGYIELRG
ncbi:MAG: hypothetical protein M1500_00250 [Candidatus Marsarchaeota archaeon]|nr:hypothetical protein [Candidatus Marsarchaeota archaeon]MCL5112137.1 hypothetical protein [Candidatus Marsarchaeota archaeon]